MTDVIQLLANNDRDRLEQWCRQRAMVAAGPDMEIETEQGLLYVQTNLCRVLGEWLMLVNRDDLSITPHLELDGFWEMWITMWMARKLKPGMRCIDVGANVGYYSVLMGRAVGPSGRVHSYEPLQETHAILAANWRLNGRWSGYIYRMLVGAGGGTRVIHLPNEACNYGGASVLEEADSGDWQVAEQVTLDSKMMETLHYPVDLMKIDVEGFEPEVWKGSAEVRARSPQLEIVMEWTPRKYEDAGAFFDAIVTEGWRPSILGSDSLLVPTTRDHLLGIDDLENIHLVR